MIEIKSLHPVKGYLESRIGGRPENQDACSYQDTPLGLLVLVCDGMGGVNGGSTASSMAVQSIISEIMGCEQTVDPVLAITDAVNHANEAIIQAGLQNPSLAGMGTTLTLLLLTDLCAYTTYVGDSRIYQLRGKEKVYRSFDHSVVFQLVRQGVITEEQARLSSQSNIIMQALGVKANLDFIVEQLPYESGDRFILCTDGYWGSMSEPVFLAKMSARKDPARIVHETVLEIDGKGAAKGGNHDNLTVAFVEVQCDSILKPNMNKKAKIIIASVAFALVISLVLNIVQLSRKPDPDADKTREELIHERDSLSQCVENLKSLTESMEVAAKENETMIKELTGKVAELEKAK